MTSDPQESVSSAAEQPQSDPVAAATSTDAVGSPEQVEQTGPEAQEAAAQSTARIKIGTQRPGVVAPRIEPRVKFVATTKPPRREPASVKPEEHAERSSQPPQGVPIEARRQKVLSQAEGQSAAEEDFPAPVLKKEQPGQPTRMQRPPKPELPNLREELSPDLSQELDAAMGNMSLDELIQGTTGAAAAETLEQDDRRTGKVLRISREQVFLDLGGRNEGWVPLRQFAQPPELGSTIEVTVIRHNPEEGLYELSLPEAPVDVGNWSEVNEGMIVEARITEHNKGGLVAEVSNLRGFIPASQIATYRVEDLASMVGQKLSCVVTEVNPEQRRLVLSRRAMLEREQQESRDKLLAELEVGQVREGVVRNIRDFGAFIDLGGVDGLIHVSQLGWERVKHPSEVLEVGQRVKVKVQKIDPATHKISLAYRDLLDNPWSQAAIKYPPTSVVSGTVSKLMDFGAFVRLEAGIEGLIHISELSHRRVHRTSDVVSEGQHVEVKVLSVDPEAQRMSLSLKALETRAAPQRQEPAEEEEAAPPPNQSKRKVPLKGGLGRGAGGEGVGLRW